MLALTASNAPSCIICKDNHQLFQCKTFLAKTAKERVQFVKFARVCLYCLRTHHFSSNCKSSNCKICRANHNTLLQLKSEAINHNEIASSMPSTSTHNIVNCVSAFASNHETLLATAEVLLSDGQGKMHVARVLLDAAAKSNFVTENLVNRLKLKTHNYNFNVSAFNNNASTLNVCATIHVSSKNENLAFYLPCFVTPSITSQLSRNSFDMSELKPPQNIDLADEHFKQSREVDILINATTS